MAWTDRPTKAQLNAIYRFIVWRLPTAEAINMVDWLEVNSTRREVSEEMQRVRELYLDHKLTKEECYNSPIWDSYKARKRK